MAFERDQLVFAKMKGFSPWPARIIEQQPLGKTPGKNIRYSVFFFGTHDIGIIGEKELFTFEENKEKLGVRKKNRTFNAAMDEIESDPDAGLVIEEEELVEGVEEPVNDAPVDMEDAESEVVTPAGPGKGKRSRRKSDTAETKPRAKSRKVAVEAANEPGNIPNEFFRIEDRDTLLKLQATYPEWTIGLLRGRNYPFPRGDYELVAFRGLYEVCGGDIEPVVRYIDLLSRDKDSPPPSDVVYLRLLPGTPLFLDYHELLTEFKAPQVLMELKSSLNIKFPEPELAVAIMAEFDKLRITGLILQRHRDIFASFAKIRNYVDKNVAHHGKLLYLKYKKVYQDSHFYKNVRASDKSGVTEPSDADQVVPTADTVGCKEEEGGTDKVTDGTAEEGEGAADTAEGTTEAVEEKDSTDIEAERGETTGEEATINDEVEDETGKLDEDNSKTAEVDNDIVESVKELADPVDETDTAPQEEQPATVD